MVTYRQGAQFGRIPTVGRLGFSLRLKANSILRLTDEVTGAFRGGKFQKALEAAHHEASENIQRKMLQQLNTRKSATGRPQVRLAHEHKPGALGLAIMDRKNRFVNASGFKVGIPSWMDSEESQVKRYWRQIEAGAPAREAHGFFYGFNKIGRAMRSFPSHKRRGVDARFFEGRGPRTTLGPFPAYRYSEAGTTFGKFQPMVPIYTKHLGAAGLPITGALRKK